MAVGANENLGVDGDGEEATVPPEPNADAAALAPKTDLPGAALLPPLPNAPKPLPAGFAAPKEANPPPDDDGELVVAPPPPPKTGAEPKAEPDPNGDALGAALAAAPNPPPPVLVDVTAPKAEKPPEEGTEANAEPAAGVVALTGADGEPNGELEAAGLVADDGPNAPNPLPSEGAAPKPEVVPNAGVDVVEDPNEVEPNAVAGALGVAMDPNAVGFDDAPKAGGVDAAPNADGAANAPNAVGADAAGAGGAADDAEVAAATFESVCATAAGADGGGAPSFSCVRTSRLVTIPSYLLLARSFRNVQ